jgi:hypothetical protein
MEKQKTDAFGRTEEQQKDLDKRTVAIIENLKGLTRSECDLLLNRANYFLENTAIIN